MPNAFPHPFYGAKCGLHVRFTPDSIGNPFVHSLLVTLGNHTITPIQPYNCPCPTGHVSNRSLAT
jgi:hypothetical protein